MSPEEIAALAGVEMSTPEAGRERAAGLVTGVQTAPDRMEAAELMASVFRDSKATADLAALARADPGAWAGVLAQLRAVRGMSTDVRTLDKLIHRLITPVRLAGPREGIEAPRGVPDGYTVPNGWQMDSSGIYVVRVDGGGESLVPVATAPLWVVGRLVDVDTGRHAVELAWHGWHGGLVTAIVDSTTAADSRSIIALADQGAPVHSANARELVRFIDACRARNGDRLPVRRTARRMGWIDGGFMLGSQWIGDQDRPVELRVDDGAAQVAAGVSTAGTWEGSLQALDVVRGEPYPWIVAYASVASVLLHPLDAREGFVVDISGETSHGKTSILRLGASFWGDPTPRGLLQSWNLTPARAEGIASLFCHLPWWLDDTKSARRPEDVSGLLYMQAAGQGKGRAKPDGLRASATWLNSLGSSGEQTATSFSQDAGARARTICLVGSPLSTREQADKLNSLVLDNYGHMGPRLIEVLLQPGFVVELKRAWKTLHAQWISRLSSHGEVAGRLAALCAHLEAAAWVLHVKMGIEEPTCDPWKALQRAVIAGGRDSDRPAEALRMLYELAMAQSDCLWSPGREAPGAQWIGSWNRTAMWSYLALRPQWVRERLDHADFDRGVIDRWIERGWLDLPNSAHWGMPTQCGEARTRLLRFRRDALVACGAIGGE